LSGLREQFDRIVDRRELAAVFQPVVDLSSGRLAGFEALIRGPRGSALESPVALFEQAYLWGRAAELDWACQAAAFRAALEAGLPTDFTLFVNVEPASLRAECPPDLVDAITLGIRRLNAVLELTERYLIEDPAGVLAAVHVAREKGLGIAIDDVGAEPASLAMMPLVRPDVIKLDMSLIQGGPDPSVARTVNGVLAEVERTGATVLAEGIETRRHEATAHAMGATLAQGWRYGRPGPLPRDWPAASGHTTGVQRSRPRPDTPFETVTRLRPPRPATRQLLQSLSGHLEYRAADPAEPAVLVACFDDTRRLTPRLAMRFSSIAARSVMVAAFGVDMPLDPGPGIRGQRLAADDPLAREWVVVVVGAHFGAALVARRAAEPNVHGAGDDALTRFDYAVTYDRDLVIEAARSLVQRMQAIPARVPA
jgi:EAL domain-containing protein (putative c-di-GMP-specific phosphodiesterase class I)